VRLTDVSVSRFGAVVRNVSAPAFGAGASAFVLKRQARADVSAALWSGWYLDGQVIVGADRGRRGWGMALSVTF
jgi:hypothetical protein